MPLVTIYDTKDTASCQYPTPPVSYRRNNVPFVRSAVPADHAAIRDVHVIGVPDARLGEEIAAWIRLRPGARPMTAAHIRAYADGQLARYKIPRYVRIVEDFPMTASGKVRKVDMRKTAITMLGLADIAASHHA